LTNADIYIVLEAVVASASNPLGAPEDKMEEQKKFDLIKKASERAAAIRETRERILALNLRKSNSSNFSGAAA
jgi:hypothetical protein